MPTRLRLLGLAAGAAATLLGVITSAGWLLDVPALVQFHPSVAPMVLHTALCFLLAGLGLLAHTLRRTIACRCCGVVIVALATFTLTAYLTNPGLRIDQLASGAKLADPRDPGRPLRMAPNTATAFLLVGLALALAGSRARSPAVAASGVAGIAVVSLSMVALVGYLFGIEPAFGWGRMVAMSPQTAVGLAIVGFATLLLVGRPDLTVGHPRKRWMAVVVGAASTTITLLLWQALVAHQEHTLQARLDAEASSIRNAVSWSLQLHVDGLVRLARRWEGRVAPRREDWEEDAGAYVKDFAGYAAVEWVAPQGTARWVVPRGASVNALEADLLARERGQATFEEATRTDSPVSILGPVKLRDGPGFLVLVPLAPQSGVGGFLLAGLRGAPFLRSLLSAESRSDHGVALSLAGENLAASSESSPSPAFRSRSDWLLLGRQWTVELVPTASWSRHQQSAVPLGALCGGLVFSGLLAWSVLKTGEARLTSASLERANQDAKAQAKAVALINDRFVREVEERLVAEQQRDQYFSLSIDMICVSSADGYFKRLNPAFEQTLGYTVEELTGRPFLDFIHPDDVAKTLAEVDRQVVAGLPTMQFENRYRHKDGTYRWLAWRSMPDVTSGLMYALARDVTEEKLAAGRLHASEERYRGLVETATDIIYRTDLAGTFTFVNAVAARVMGYSEGELLGKHFSELVRPDQRAEVRLWYETRWRAKAPVTPREFPAVAKDGHELWIEQTVQPVMQGDRIVAFQAIARDVTSRKALETDRERLILELQSTLAEVQTLSVQMETLSLTDALTGVPNRRAFEQALGREIARARRHSHALGLLALDIDHFKRVNDTYGHEGGDDVLRGFTRTVLGVLRKGDSLYRTGGEEFAVILPYADADPLMRAAERIVAAVAVATIDVGERRVTITASAGAACLQPGGDGREVWAKADAALYQAKASGRNRACLWKSAAPQVIPA